MAVDGGGESVGKGGKNEGGEGKKTYLGICKDVI